ncbi:G-protein coupled receptor 1 [Bagarius yarrelli]|uniref:G-protein coupled receptor 1 n=1 Tax=Bagarius yarrelli TaxID=175774 RepID=A0A556U4N6_BAGYA|nr:G-protein coupled receptor 1 [Bagarius yarrelli]
MRNLEEADYDNVSYEYMEYGDFEEKAEIYTQKETLHIISVVIYSLAFVIGVIGNGIVIWVTAFKIKRTINSVWLQNLAIADFVFVLFLPFSIDYVLRDFNWIFGWTMCKLNSFICTVNMYASVLFLTVLSLDRYISLVHLNWYQRFRTVPRAWIVCVLIWVISSLLSSPALIFRETLQYHSKIVCFNNFHSEDAHVGKVRHISMVILRATVGFLLPFLTISVTAILLSRKMRQFGNVRFSSFSKMISAVIVAFFLCWAPFHTFSLMELTMHHTGSLGHVLKVGFPLATSLAFFNSCINPILYGLLNKNVRAIIKGSCISLTKKSLRELSNNLSATETASLPPSCSPEEPAAYSSV